MTTTAITASAATSLRARPVACCPRCGAVLDGGPVAYWCSRCGRGVMAADLDTTYHPPSPPEAGAST